MIRLRMVMGPDKSAAVVDLIVADAVVKSWRFDDDGDLWWQAGARAARIVYALGMREVDSEFVSCRRRVWVIESP